MVVKRVHGCGKRWNRHCVKCGKWIEFNDESLLQVMDSIGNFVGFMCSLGCNGKNATKKK